MSELLLTADIQPRNLLSPSAISPNTGADLQTNPFDNEFQDTYDDDDDEEDDLSDGGIDFSTAPIAGEEPNTFAVLNSSLPEQLPEPHHLTSYASARRAGPTVSSKDKSKQQRTKWHFGIRSRSPPMEVMLEIYRTLKTLGMEWREKKDLGGLGGVERRMRRSRHGIERARDYDGAGYVDLKKASSVYFVETRARIQDVVVSIIT